MTEDKGELSASGLSSDFTKNGYDLYLYCDADSEGDEFRTMTYTIGKQTVTCNEANSNFTPGDKLAEGVNVAVFKNLKSSDIRIRANADKGRAAINALQFVARANP